MAQTVTGANPEIGQSIQVDEIRTNYHDQGAGSPVLLVHGSGPGVSAWTNWRGVLPSLSVDRRVLAPDIVGFGYTERPSGFEFTQRAWVDHLVGFLDALQLPFVSVVGNSFGGALALWLADRHPDRVDRLVLMGSAGTRFGLTPGLDAVWGYQPSIENMAALIELFAHDRTLLGPDLARLRYEASIRPGVHESYSAMFPPPRQNGIDALALPEESVRAIRHDTLVVHGRDDKIIPLSSSLRLGELIPRAPLHVFNQCGHWTQIEKCAEFVQLLRGFLSA